MSNDAKCPHCGEQRPDADYDWLRYHEDYCHIETLQAANKALEGKLEAQLDAGKMLGESVADALKLLRAIQKDLWLRADVDRRDGSRVVCLSNSTWRKLCEAVGEPE